MVELGPIQLLVWLLYGGGVGWEGNNPPFPLHLWGKLEVQVVWPLSITVFTFAKVKVSYYFSQFYIDLNYIHGGSVC